VRNRPEGVWRFDLAGAVRSTVINVNAEPSRSIVAMLSYAAMGGADVGFDPSFRWTTSDGVETVLGPTIHPIKTFIRCARPSGRSCQELWIQPETLSRRFAIKTRGSTCLQG